MQSQLERGFGPHAPEHLPKQAQQNVSKSIFPPLHLHHHQASPQHPPSVSVHSLRLGLATPALHPAPDCVLAPLPPLLSPHPTGLRPLLQLVAHAGRMLEGGGAVAGHRDTQVGYPLCLRPAAPIMMANPAWQGRAWRAEQ